MNIYKKLCCVTVTLCTLLTIAATKPLFPPGSMIVNPLYDTLSQYNNGLVAWWLYYPKISGAGVIWRNLVDTYHGTLTNMASPGTATSGWGLSTLRKGGFGEVRFDGSNDMVVINNSSNKYTFPDANFAVEFWFYTTTTAAQQYLVNNQLGGSSSVGGWVVRLETSGLIVVRILTNTNSRALERDTVSTITTNTWHHVVVNFTTNTVTQASNEIGIFLDGKVDQSARVEGSGPYTICGCNVNIGAQDTTSFSVNGFMDNVKIYKRLLSLQEVQQHRMSDMMYASLQLNQISEITQNKLVAGGGGTSKGNFFHWFLP